VVEDEETEQVEEEEKEVNGGRRGGGEGIIGKEHGGWRRKGMLERHLP